jgi:hypothetical protein
MSPPEDGKNNAETCRDTIILTVYFAQCAFCWSNKDVIHTVFIPNVWDSLSFYLVFFTSSKHAAVVPPLLGRLLAQTSQFLVGQYSHSETPDSIVKPSINSTLRDFYELQLVSTRWQWSVNLNTNRKQTTMYMRRNHTQNNTKTQNTQNRKQSIQKKKSKKYKTE